MTDIRKYRWLIIMLISYNSVFFGADLLISIGKSSSYILALICTFLSCLIYNLIYSKKVMDFICKSERAKNIKRFFSIVVSIVALMGAVATMAYSCQNFGISFLKKSPFLYILFFVIMPVVCASYFGIKSISRYAHIAGITIFLCVIIMLALAIDEYNVQNLYPLFGNLPNRRMISGLILFSNILYLFVLSAESKCNREKLRWEISKIILISGVAMTVVCLCYNLYVPYEAVGAAKNPLLSIASSINFNLLFERCEVIIFIIWLFITFISSSSLFCLFTSAFAFGTSTTDRKAIIGAGAVIASSGAIIADKFFFHEKMYMLSGISTFAVSILIPVVSIIYYYASGGNKG